MSIKATNWAWGLSLPPAPKLILMALADEADDDGLCSVTIRRIARKAGVSERTVQRAIQKYSKSDLLRVTREVRGDGSQEQNSYHLALDAHAKVTGDAVSPPQDLAGDELSPPSDTQLSPPGGALLSPPGDALVSPLGATEVSPLYVVLKPIKTTTAVEKDFGIEAVGALSLVPPGFLSCADGAKAVRIVAASVVDQTVAQQVLDELDARAESRGIKGSWESYLKGLVRKAEANDFVPAAGKRVAQRRADALRKKLGPARLPKPSTREVADARFAEIQAELGKGARARG